jgi:hypothetical protein
MLIDPDKLINFTEIKNAALASADSVLARFLPGGKILGGEYTVRNPKRADRNLGSFRINVKTGAWADFATDARGRDLVSLVAYLEDISQFAAARLLAAMLGIKVTAPRGRRHG